MKKNILYLLFFFWAPTLWSQNNTDELYSREETTVLPLESIQTIPSPAFIADDLVLEKRSLVDATAVKKDPIIAWILSFPLGMLGVHRVYLGANPQMMAWYILSIGGVFGIIPMIDWIFLLRSIQENDMTPYIGNKKWIMWL